MSVNQTLSSRWPAGLTAAIKAAVRPLPTTGLAKVSRPRHQGGAAEILELALLVPIAMMLILGIVELSLLTSNTAILANAARVAVREAISRPKSPVPLPTAVDVRTFAKQAAGKLTLDDTNIKIINHDTNATIINPGTELSDTSIRVEISYTHKWLFLFNRLVPYAKPLIVKHLKFHKPAERPKNWSISDIEC